MTNPNKNTNQHTKPGEDAFTAEADGMPRVLLNPEETVRNKTQGAREVSISFFDKGTICLDNAVAIVKFLYFFMKKGSATSCINAHLDYGKYVEKACWQYLLKRSYVDSCFAEPSNDAGITLALQSLELTAQNTKSEEVFTAEADGIATGGSRGGRPKQTKS